MYFSRRTCLNSYSGPFQSLRATQHFFSSFKIIETLGCHGKLWIWDYLLNIFQERWFSAWEGRSQSGSNLTVFQQHKRADGWIAGWKYPSNSLQSWIFLRFMKQIEDNEVVWVNGRKQSNLPVKESCGWLDFRRWLRREAGAVNAGPFGGVCRGDSRCRDWPQIHEDHKREISNYWATLPNATEWFCLKWLSLAV